MQTNILEYLEATVAKKPEKVAFSDADTSLTFGQVYDQARSVATALRRAGYYKKPVVVFMRKQPATLAAFFGAIYAGCYYVPLDDEMPLHRIELIFKTLEPGALICDETTEAIAAELNYQGQVYTYESLAHGQIDEAALGQIRAQQLDIDPIYIVFTSGSTGVPKGVMACHRSVIDYIEHLCDVLKFDETTVFGNQTPLYFDAYLKEVIPTLKYGATTVLIPKQLFMFPIKLVEFLNEKGINTLCWVVSALTMISSFRTFDTVKPEHLRTIAFASEVFPMKQFKRWKEALPNCRFINLYGPTETTGICCYYEVDREFEDHETLPIGGPFPNTQILLLDENDKVPEVGQQGEICVRGTRLTLGYYCNPEKTAEAFVQNPLNKLYPELIYRTGDLGKLNERGELEFAGRKDYQIKHMGHRIELGEIEKTAAEIAGVAECCALYHKEKELLYLFYTGEAASKQIVLHFRTQLPAFMVPRKLIQLEELPRLPNGKLDMNSLKNHFK